ARIIRDDGICVGLPRDSRGPGEFTRTGAGNCESGAIRCKIDGRNGLIELIEEVDLQVGGGVGVGERGSMRDRIDGDTLSGIGKTAENQVGTAKEDGSSVGGAATGDVRAQEVRKGCAAGDGDREYS